MYTIYQLLLTLLFYTILPFLLLYVLKTGKHREGLRQRFGLYNRLSRRSRGFRIWLHAASVGEVQAAGVLINALRNELPDAEFVVTTMTLHGRKLAQSRLGADVPCFLAPLDVPGIVDLVIHNLSPDLYVCLETELWPVLLRRLRKQSVPLVLVNGRMSERSSSRYKKHAWLFRKVVDNFDALCMISEVDKERYISLGVNTNEIVVTGNLKYDQEIPADKEQVKKRLHTLLHIDPGTEVFIAGSTHTGEEDILLPVYKALDAQRELIWIVAPRHLERINSLDKLFAQNSIGWQRFSDLVSGQKRQAPVIVLDAFGELAELYAIGTYIFCGGSLVEKNGHNILEAAIWDTAVLYGPSMGDFQDAVELLDMADCGFQVNSGKELFETITSFRDNPEEYQQACERAGIVARAQQGAATRQAQVAASLLMGSKQ